MSGDKEAFIKTAEEWVSKAWKAVRNGEATSGELEKGYLESSTPYEDVKGLKTLRIGFDPPLDWEPTALESVLRDTTSTLPVWVEAQVWPKGTPGGISEGPDPLAFEPVTNPPKVTDLEDPDVVPTADFALLHDQFTSEGFDNGTFEELRSDETC